MPLRTRRRAVKLTRAAVIVVGMVLLYLTTLENYLLFHALIEGIGVAVAVGIFMIAWNTRRLGTPTYLVFLGISYLFIAGFSLLHMLTYSGMDVIPGHTANLPTQFWIVIRYLEGFTFLAAPLLSNRRLPAEMLMAGYSLLSGIILAAIFSWHVFPACYIAGTGLTSFKIISEYVTIAMLGLALYFWYRQRERLDAEVYRCILGAIALSILAGLAFTRYSNVFGFTNMLGHFIKLLSVYFIYRAIIAIGLMEPFSILLRDIKSRESEQRQLNAELRKALSEVKQLSGLLPICANCKRIRNDGGYWEEVENYVREHSRADFTHGICPDCAHSLYPELYSDAETKPVGES